MQACPAEQAATAQLSEPPANGHEVKLKQLQCMPWASMMCVRQLHMHSSPAWLSGVPILMSLPLLGRGTETPGLQLGPELALKWLRWAISCSSGEDDLYSDSRLKISCPAMR